MQIEFGVEYYPNPNEGEQWEEEEMTLIQIETERL